jgi:hypothetical protein
MQDAEFRTIVRRLEDDPVAVMKSKDAKANAERIRSVSMAKATVGAAAVAAAPVTKLLKPMTSATPTTTNENVKVDDAHQQPPTTTSQRIGSSASLTSISSSADPYHMVLLSRQAAEAARGDLLRSVAPLQSGVASQFRVRGTASDVQPLNAYGLDIFEALAEEEKSAARRWKAEQQSSSCALPSPANLQPPGTHPPAASSETSKFGSATLVRRIATLMRSDGVTQPSADDTVTLAHMVVAAQRSEQAYANTLHNILTCSLPEEEAGRAAIVESERLERGPLAARSSMLTQKYFEESAMML